MCRIARATALLSVGLLLGGCAGAGRDFIRPNADSFQVGQTTFAQVTQKMGEPKTTSEVLQNGKHVKTIVYSCANASGQPLEEGVIPYRGMTYFFYDDTLVGEQFVSSFKLDNTNFDDALTDRVQKGRTTREDAVALFGPPSALFIPPMVKETSSETIGYTYHAIRGGLFTGLKQHIKVLHISFDGGGVVTDIEHSVQAPK